MTPEKSRAEYVQCVQSIDPAFGQTAKSSKGTALAASAAPRAISIQSMAPNKPPAKHTPRTDLRGSTVIPSPKAMVRISALSEPVSKRSRRRRQKKRNGSIRTLAGLVAMFCWALLLLTAPLARICAEAERLLMKGTVAQDALRIFDVVDVPIARHQLHPFSGNELLASSDELARAFSCVRDGNCSK